MSMFTLSLLGIKLPQEIEAEFIRAAVLIISAATLLIIAHLRMLAEAIIRKLDRNTRLTESALSEIRTRSRFHRANDERAAAPPVPTEEKNIQ